MEREAVNGVNIYAPSSRNTLIKFALDNQQILIAVNAEKILHASSKSRGIINRNVGYPDGVGAVMGLNSKGFDKVERIPGCELWLDTIAYLYEEKSFYCVGGREDVIERTVAKLKKDFPGIKIVNHRNGYFENAGEEQALIEDIVEKKPDVVFVAMGSPRQEFLMEKMSERHKALYQGLGGSFDLYTGKTRRAPEWWIRNNLEWLYRLIREPGRIKRDIHLVRFFVLLKLGRI